MTAPAFQPIGRRVLLALLPEPPKSSLLITEGIAPEGLTRRATVVAAGERCKYVTPGDVVVVRTTTGKTVGDHLVIEEQACVAIVEGA